jgi:hypothetical protein
MSTTILLIKFFTGLILFFAVGWLIGHFLKLDKKYEDLQKELKNRYEKES